ncbi:MAG: DNA polymerase/3'-5' exonuclease PolX [Syntrophomonadaceae bacterium]|jgi:DNA polymerase (family 10)|nr:DNA polymerase/3'-5' exonuclease PolX [Syntrophomonadaceae bacterium]
MDNKQAAILLDEIADMLEILGENQFKSRAYRKVARELFRLETDLRQLWREGRLQDIPGVGAAIQGKLEEMLQTGDLQYYQELSKKVPSGVVEMLRVPGLGPRTIGHIYRETGIDTLEKLYKAAQARELRQLRGLGAKTEYNIKKGVEMLESIADKVSLGLALPLAEELREHLSAGPGVEKAAVTGSVRRGKPVVGDIDILVAAHEEQLVRQSVKRYRWLQRVTEEKAGYVAGRLQPGIDFEVIIVEPDDFHLALLLSTGSGAHREKLLPRMEGVDFTAIGSEAGIYEHLSLQYIPPELREDRGELELAREGKLPQLVEFKDLQGDLHLHTDWSDGANSIAEMADAARKMGYTYMAITEHSKSLTVSRGLDEERLLTQIQEIKALNETLTGFKVLSGIEVDILADGSLDLSDEVLQQADVVIASIHSYFRLSRSEQTRRIIKAIRHPQVDIIGHLTGRLLLRRPGYEVDVEAVLAEAARCGKALEINAHPDRLDVSEEVARRARELGIKMVINSDAHHCADLSLVKYGVLTARRGWLQKEDVLNTMELDELQAYLKRRS